MRTQSKPAFGIVRLLSVGLLTVGMVCLNVSFSSAVYAQGEGEEHLPQLEEAEGEDHGEHGEEHATEAPVGFQADLALWGLIVFVLFLVILRATAWEPLVTNLDAREARVRADILGAEEARKKAELMLQEHAKKLDAVQDEVREILAEARRDAEHTKQDIIAAANKEAEATRQRVISEIERAKDQALADVFSRVTEQVSLATEHVLGRALTDEDQNRLVQDALAQMSAASRN